MNLDEARARAETEGTQRVMAFRKTIRNLIKVTTSVVVILFLTVLVTNWANQPSAGGREVAMITPPPARQVVGNPRCNQIKQEHHFGVTLGEPMNPAGECSGELWYKGHCIFVRVAGSSKSQRFCHKDGVTEALPEDIEYAWSAGEPFVGYKRLGPPRYTKYIAVR